jgi:actin-related protein 8
LLSELEEVRLQVSHTLQSCLQSDGRKRYATPPQQISAFNKRSIPDILTGIPESNWYEPDIDYVVGSDVLKIAPNGRFNVHFPIRRGELNIHKNVNGSLVSVLEDLRCIWEYFIKYKLEIDLNDLNNYRAVLIIPAIYNRTHLKEMTNILLLKMGFGSCFLVQDHVAATFGAGLGKILFNVY